MTRRDQAGELRERGHSYGGIAVILGVHPSTAYRWLNPDSEKRSRSTSREWKERNPERVRAYGRAYTMSATCECCGGSCYRDAQMCAECRSAGIQLRNEDLAAMYIEGHPVADIADRFDMSPAQVRVLITHLRRLGWDIPYRQRRVMQR